VKFLTSQLFPRDTLEAEAMTCPSCGCSVPLTASRYAVSLIEALCDELARQQHKDPETKQLLNQAEAFLKGTRGKTE